EPPSGRRAPNVPAGLGGVQHSARATSTPSQDVPGTWAPSTPGAGSATTGARRTRRTRQPTAAAPGLSHGCTRSDSPTRPTNPTVPGNEVPWAFLVMGRQV